MKKWELKKLVREEIQSLRENETDEFYLNIAINRFKNVSGIKTLWDTRKKSGKYPTWETNLNLQVSSNGILSMLFSDIILVTEMRENTNKSATFTFRFEWKLKNGKRGTTDGGTVYISKTNANRTQYFK